MKKIYLLLLLLLGYVAVLNLFHSGLPITHDGQDHVARIANFYQNLAQGNMIPRWAPNLNWGYGHPILMFLYPLPSYFTSLFHFIGFSLIDSTKIVFGSAFILSGITMFIWARNFLPQHAAFFSAVLYMFAPYRFVDLYVRGALGEHVAFVFPPLILYFLLKLSKQYSYWLILGGSMSLAGLILSHNAISLMFLPIVILYAIFLLWSVKGKKLLMHQYTSILVVGLGLSAFFWIPAFFEGKYTLRDIVTAGDYRQRFVLLKDLIYSAWSFGINGQFSVQVGILHWIFLLTSPVLLFWKQKKKEKIFALSLIIYTFLAIFIMLPISDFIWNRVVILQNFQFPWRFLVITVFTTSVLGALVVSKIPTKVQMLAVLISSILALFLSKDYWHAQGYLQKPENFFTSVYSSTTDTGESAPIWSVRFMEKRAKAPVEVISGEALVRPLQRNATRHTYQVYAKDTASFRENTLYFPGWKVLVDSKMVDIKFQDPNNRGLITFSVNSGKHVVEVIFEETKLRLFSNLISAFSLILLLGYNVWSVKLWRRFL